MSETSTRPLSTILMPTCTIALQRPSVTALNVVVRGTT
jgi:hypothetical protein